MSTVYCGVDWAESHHDIALVDEQGKLVAKRRITEPAEGFAELVGLLAEAGDDPADPIPVAIETPRGLLVAVLRASGRPVYPINPMAVARYRERRTVARSKSDHVDAMTLANILRTDMHAHRQLPADSELARSIAVLARAHQDAIWRRTKASNELRSLLREYFPGFLAIFAHRDGGLTSRVARAVLAIAPTPAKAARLSTARIAAALRRAGRQRGIDALAVELRDALRVPQLRQEALVEQAMGSQALRLLATLDTECDSVNELAAATADAFAQHPDYAIITSFPGLADTTGARVLAEIGDDRDRFTDARALQAFAGSAPVTRASGRSIVITYRKVKNDRLAAAGFVWAFAALTGSPGARAHYDRRRAAGDRHAAALRHLFNRMLGLLLAVIVTAASVQDSAGGQQVLDHLAAAHPTVSAAWVDGGYNNTVIRHGAQRGIRVEVVKRPSAKGFHVLPRRWVVERSLGWLMQHRRLARDYEALPQRSRTMVHWAMTNTAAAQCYVC
ncbi:IS110 family transposase [Kibdelosporangium philippinense]|uniref:IS110 family transposase n=1 Tax=Kibdelosporangium philippinense TaxID=211113 RepID=A0ABS8Z5V7_9PSEU|nr:IS110 family transposase [Kibdelosporangium philippinense]MCE7003278.1 IS110 family transposase [Kibdelosporangium philippinense]